MNNDEEEDNISLYVGMGLNEYQQEDGADLKRTFTKRKRQKIR